MDYSLPFSDLNQMMKPRLPSSETVYYSLSRLQGRHLSSPRSPASRATVLPAEPEPPVGQAETPEPQMAAPDEPPQQGSLLYHEVDCSDLGSATGVFCGGRLAGDGDSSSCQSEGKDSACEVASEGTGEPPESVLLPDEEAGSPFQRSYEDRSLPDLINSGRPLGRRRTLGHVSDTLKEVRREVELSRRRSMKLKAQVDKLQERREGTGWSQHREAVTAEVLSVLRLLHPLTQVEFSAPEQAETQLDTALVQLKIVARQLAVGHTQQGSQCGRKSEDAEVLEQALRDRDEAIEKKQAMEAELLRSKTELMMLNNQLLEAAQKRLELSLELEAWKEDVQVIIQQQLQSQQQAEQVQKKPSRMGLLRRTNKAPMQRPSNFPVPAQTPPPASPAQIYVPKAAGSPAPVHRSPATGGTLPRNWMTKLKRNKNSRSEPESPSAKDEDGFHVVSLD
ncbi:bicaudal-D-related protein 2-like [Synchiropus splendidus]|uniref:bicaudal-D-related protein 2-like n=1 Tax=Synchiropus splendidus TaxID=270530 RepID=UPI00237DAF62|nr:bicaudal-D-related protein 2-like [Synchiropus splendidus]